MFANRPFWIEKLANESFLDCENYLKILCDDRNKFPDVRKNIVREAIEGLKQRTLSFENKKSELSHASLPSSEFKFFGNSNKKGDMPEEKSTAESRKKSHVQKTNNMKRERMEPSRDERPDYIQRENFKEKKKARMPGK